MKWSIIFTSCLFLSVLVFADEKDVISAQMEGYWDAYSHSNFATAATFVHPSELEEMKKELLPVFLVLAESSDQELRAIANAFFAGVPEKSRKEISANKVFVGLNNIITVASPQLFEALAHSEIEITELNITSPKDAVLAYKIIMQGAASSDIERFSKFNDQWFVRLKEPAADTALKFRRAFGL